MLLLCTRKHRLCGPCFQKGPRFPASPRAPQISPSGPRDSQPLGSCPRPSRSTLEDALVRTLSRFCSKPPGCRACGNILKMFFCATEAPAREIPAASAPSSQAAPPNCWAAGSCVTKGMSPANRTFARPGEAGLPESRVITPRQLCVLLLCYLIECPVCMHINTAVLTHHELVNARSYRP